MRLNGTYQFLVYANDVNILGESVHTILENAEALLVASKETRIGANVDETKYIVMSRDQNARRSHDVQIDNNSFEIVEDFEYLGKTLTIKILFSKKLRAY